MDPMQNADEPLVPRKALSKNAAIADPSTTLRIRATVRQGRANHALTGRSGELRILTRACHLEEQKQPE